MLFSYHQQAVSRVLQRSQEIKAARLQRSQRTTQAGQNPNKPRAVQAHPPPMAHKCGYI